MKLSFHKDETIETSQSSEQEVGIPRLFSCNGKEKKRKKETKGEKTNVPPVPR